MAKVSARYWTRAITRVDDHVTACKAGKSGCHTRLKDGVGVGGPDCAIARRLMRLEDRARNAYRKAGGKLPVQ